MEIKYANYLVSSALITQCPEHRQPEYAFIGRSNVGKSSLINMLTGNSKLAKTSAKPGKTILINHFAIFTDSPAGGAKKSASTPDWYLVDLPGYGFAQRSKTERDKLEQMIRSYILQREQMTNLFLLIDVRLEPQKIDLEFMQWLGQSSIPFSIMFTKADKLSRQKLTQNVNAYLERLSQEWEPLPPHFVTSAETKMGRSELLDYIDHINKSLQ